jgi:NAD(P)-dependent dehydrogenase (short-subunit alcohol dehydrogenase family)
MDEDTRERQRDGIPLGRLGRPEDLRGAVTLLASESGRWITGQNIVVDGGWSAW